MSGLDIYNSQIIVEISEEKFKIVKVNLYPVRVVLEKIHLHEKIQALKQI